MGVRRAVEMIFDLAARNPDTPLYTYGPLIHNTQVLEVLRQRGIAVLDRVPCRGRGTVLLRAHGVPPEIPAQLKAAGFDVQNATCPRVRKIQNIIHVHTRKGAEAIIVGDREHPEVIGLQGYARGRGHVIGDLEALRRLPPFRQAIVVAQSTQNMTLFEEVRDWVQTHQPHYRVFDTICDSTENRQAELRGLAAEVEAVIVVGGRTSGNTRRLADVARESGKPVWHIETHKDLQATDWQRLAAFSRIGVSAGASTPNWVIKKVVRTLAYFPLPYKLGLMRRLYRFQRILLLANLYAALAAGCLAYACVMMEGIAGGLSFFFLSTFYVLSMHTINHLTGQSAQPYNDPERAQFYRDHHHMLLGLATIAAILGSAVAASIGALALSVYVIMSVMGLAYHLDLVPARFSRGRARRISDIPASKIFLVAIAWPVLAVLVPALSLHQELGRLHLVLFVWAGGLAFVRTAFKDILDMQGDRIVGRKTIALILGEKALLRLLNAILVALILLLAVAAALKWVPPVAFGVTLGPVFYLLLLQAFRLKTILPGIRLDLLAESHFILVGLITVIWPFKGW